MKPRRGTKLMVEPPASATGDIAFNLIVFFLACVSVQPNEGRKQEIPARDEQNQPQKSENVVVTITRDRAAINGDVVQQRDFIPLLKRLLETKRTTSEKVVVVESKPDVPYYHWIAVTEAIEEAGGIITIKIVEESTVVVPN